MKKKNNIYLFYDIKNYIEEHRMKYNYNSNEFFPTQTFIKNDYETTNEVFCSSTSGKMNLKKQNMTKQNEYFILFLRLLFIISIFN